MNEPLLTPCDAARLLVLSVSKIKLMVQDDQIPHVVLPDGQIRFSAADLQAWAASLKRLPATTAVGREFATP